MKKFLFLMSQIPHRGSHVQETLDFVLTTAAFDQAVALLFLDEGVTQLVNHQHPEQYRLKATAAIFQALEIYDIKHIYVEIESLQERSLKPKDLILTTQEIYRKDVSTLCQQYDVIISD